MDPLVCVGEDFEDEYPGADRLATEAYANLLRSGELLMELHDRQTQEQYRLSASARQVLAVVDGAGEPLEPSVIADRLLVTTGSMTSLLDNLEKRGLVVRQPHPGDRRKLLVDITPAAHAILDQLLPSLHARERDVMAAALSPSEQRALLRLLAKVQHAGVEARSAPHPTGSRRRSQRKQPRRGTRS
jgi:DNA-binding MarR family transcriptional regulator